MGLTNNGNDSYLALHSGCFVDSHRTAGKETMNEDDLKLVEQTEDAMKGVRRCHACGGRGVRRNGRLVVLGEPCGSCDGEGKVKYILDDAGLAALVPASHPTPAAVKSNLWPPEPMKS